MAYLIFTANGDGFDRRELIGPTVIGRAPDCDVSVHDIVLSRHHCQVARGKDEHGDEIWIITDLHSKNGTHLRGRPIEKHTLHEGDELRIGRTRVTFLAGEFVPGRAVRRRAVVRANDPVEALAGTVSGMVICEPGESGVFPGLPSPKPRPADPSAYASEDVYGMISDIISNSWDSVMAQNSEPVRMQRAMPVAAITKATRGSVKPRPRVSFALQADDRRRDEEILVISPAKRSRRKRRWLYASASAAVLLVGFMIWQAMSRQTPANASPPPPLAKQGQVDANVEADVSADEADDVASDACVDIDASLGDLTDY